MKAPLAVQASIVATLKADAAVLALVPAANIFDRVGRPEVFPCVLLGDDQVIGTEAEVGPSASRTARQGALVVTLHVWERSGGLAGAKAIGAAVEDALHGPLTPYVGQIGDRDLSFQGARYMRDPDGISGHGVLTFTCPIVEVRL